MIIILLLLFSSDRTLFFGIFSSIVQMTPLKLKQMVKRRQIQIKSLLVPLRNEKLHLVQVFKHLLVPDIIILAITVMPERRIVPNQAFVACLILAIHVS